MTPEEKRALVDRYLSAYNAFDIDGMMTALHPAIEFRNITGGEVNARASGLDELRKLAGQANAIFSSHEQTIIKFEAEDDRAAVEVQFRGVIAADFPNGMKRGQALELIGRTEFGFRDGLICAITDIS